MDANRQQPYLLAEARQWSLAETPSVLFDEKRRVLRLASARSRSVVEDETLARQWLRRVPEALDRFGTRARWDEATHRVLARGGSADGSEIALYSATPGWPVSDLCVGRDEVLYLLAGGRLVLKDLRERWELVDHLITLGFTGYRLAAAPGGGVYVLDRIFRHLARVEGLPMRPWRGTFSPRTFRPVSEDPDPPAGHVLSDATIPDDEEAVALATSPAGRVALLTWCVGADARLRVLDEHDRFGPPQTLLGARFPYSFEWLSEDRIALLLALRDAGTLREALAYPVLGASLGQPSQSLALGDLYPLREHTGGPFLRSPVLPPRYPSACGALPLEPLAWPSFAECAAVRASTSLDSGSATTAWHRLYLEAVIPNSCGVRVWLAATDDPVAPEPTSIEWHEHHFGAVPPSTTPEVPRGAWLRERSEIPLHPGMLACPRREGEVGLFSVLIQRANRRVRTLVGRHLWVRLDLVGDGRSTPEVAAVRAYASRHSYTEYLPRLYRESLVRPEADAVGPSTRADFLERFLATFESVLTPLEDRIAAAHLFTDPRTVPEEALEWLASWIGYGFLPGISSERRRAMLSKAAELYTKRGTLAGLTLAIDLATGGACYRGEVVVVEDFRLRRTFATILGADLADEADQLEPGLAVSGNSYVGDTLILGEESKAEFLALFGAGLELGTSERQAVAALFDRLAHRVTVLVHQATLPQDLGLITEIAAREVPAHLELKVVTATERFLVGISSLVGVDTFLVSRPVPQPARLDVSEIGRGDVVEHLPSLDPRLGRPTLQQPTALIAAPESSATDAPFVLEGSGSHPAPGHRIVHYRWMLIR